MAFDSHKFENPLILFECCVTVMCYYRNMKFMFYQLRKPIFLDRQIFFYMPVQFTIYFFYLITINVKTNLFRTVNLFFRNIMRKFQIMLSVLLHMLKILASCFLNMLVHLIYLFCSTCHSSRDIKVLTSVQSF